MLTLWIAGAQGCSASGIAPQSLSRAFYNEVHSWRDMAERVVLITGARGGLGAAVTRAFRDAGSSVAAVDRSLPAQPNPDSRILEFNADLTAPQEAPRVVEAVKARFGRIDALVHLVGGFEGGMPVSQTGDGVWTRMLDLNLNCAFYTVRAVLPLMLEAGHGRIVAIGSRTAVEPAATLSAYGASKAALVALIRTVALEVRRPDITANVILPSVIDTPANRASNPGADFSKWVTPDSIARLLLWLASDEAADVNGAVIPIYGRA
jgi:NAD(P)-dependent dehydrogenase (short-subunit alcohol dehydrogenase family)